MDKLMLAVAVVVAGVWVLRHLSAYNRRVCPKCKGTGTVKSWILFGRHRQCPRCGGANWVRGWGGRPE